MKKEGTNKSIDSDQYAKNDQISDSNSNLNEFSLNGDDEENEEEIELAEQVYSETMQRLRNSYNAQKMEAKKTKSIKNTEQSNKN